MSWSGWPSLHPGRRGVIVAVVLALAFSALAVVSHHAGHGTPVDHSVLSWMIDHRRREFTALAIVITDAGSPVAMTLLALLASGMIWWRQSSPKTALVVMATLAAATATSTLTKAAVGAQRPSRAVQLIAEVDPSFPSGHVTGTVTLFGMVAVVVGRNRGTATRWVLACAVIAAALAIAVTRLYLGVHWLTDVCGGMLLGSVAVTLGACCLTTVARSGQGPCGKRADSPAPTATGVA